MRRGRNAIFHYGMKRYAIANWKMNPGTPAEAKKIFKAIEKEARGARKVTTVVCPPAIFLADLKAAYKGKRVPLGVQDVFFEPKGSWTGQISAEMAAAAGASYAIIGHSERRALGEDNSTVEKKLRAALRAGLTAVLCVGERERDRSGDYFAFVEEELVAALRATSRKEAGGLIIAYEPIFAIGKSAEDALPPEGVEEMAIFIRKTLAGLYDAEVAKSIPILYGGSVESANAGALAGVRGISGFLVGHASLVPKEFSVIISALQAQG